MLLGLHLTKCGGTSFETSVRRICSTNDYYFCSSVIENIAQGVLEFPMRPKWRSIEIVFGHYINLWIYRMYAEFKDVTTFTILRNPRTRMESEWRQFVVRASLQEQSKLDAFVASTANSLCSELLRFLDAEVADHEIEDTSLDMLCFFDRIFNIEAASLLESWMVNENGYKNFSFVKDNELHGRDLGQEYEHGLETLRKLWQTGEIGALDTTVYQRYVSIDSAERASRRKRILDRIQSTVGVAGDSEMFSRSLARYYAAEFSFTGSTELFASLKGKCTSFLHEIDSCLVKAST